MNIWFALFTRPIYKQNTKRLTDGFQKNRRAEKLSVIEHLLGC